MPSAIRRVSASSTGSQLTDRSDSPSISLHGRILAFENYGPDVVPGDTNGFADVFTHTRDTKAQHLVAVARGEVVESIDFGSLIVPPEVLSIVRGAPTQPRPPPSLSR